MKLTHIFAVSGLLFSGCSLSHSSGVSTTVDEKGGTLQITSDEDPSIAGAQLVIPPGALPVGTVITISRGDPQTTSLEAGVGPSVRISPDGLQLAKPATLFLPYEASSQHQGTQLLVAYTSKSVRGESYSILVNAKAGLAQVQLEHFSDYQIVAATCVEDPGPVDMYPTPDIAYQPVDLGSSGNVDLAYPNYDGSSPQTDFGFHPDDFGYPTDDGGVSSNDLSPNPGTGSSGYVAPVCYAAPTPVDLSVP